MSRFLYCMIALVLCLCGRAQATEEKGIFALRSEYSFQNLSFAQDAHGVGLQFSYDKPKQWGLRTEIKGLRKFGETPVSGGFGVTYWPSSAVSLLVDTGFSPNQTVLPREFVQLEGNYMIEKFISSLGYRFSNYPTAQSHLVMPGLTWYFLPHFDWDIKYFLAISKLVGQTATTHSFLAKLNWMPRDSLRFSLGYALSHDAFESGNPAIPVSGFEAHHGIVGARWQMLKHWKIDTTCDIEKGTTGPRSLQSTRA